MRTSPSSSRPPAADAEAPRLHLRLPAWTSPTGQEAAIESVTATYSLTAAEFRWAFLTLMRVKNGRSPSRGWPWFVAAVLIGVGTTALNGAHWFTTLMLVVGLLGLATVLTLTRILPAMGYRQIPEDRAEQTLVVSPDGIRTGTSSTAQEFAWDAVIDVVRGDGITLLVTHASGEGVIIPARALDPLEHGRLDALIANYAGGAGAGPLS